MKHSKRIILMTLLTSILVLSHSLSLAQVPGQINFQGHLKTAEGYPVANGDYIFRFNIYKSQTSTTPSWTEDHVLTVTDSVYNVLLGMNVPLTADIFDFGSPWLEVEILNETGSSTGEWETLGPGMPLTSTPYSIKSSDADTLGGLDPSVYDQSVHAGDISGNPHKITPVMIEAIGVQTFNNHSGDESAHHTKTTNFSELTGFISVTQIPDDMATDEELDTKIAAHHHDNRYYSQAHVDTLEARIASLESSVNSLLSKFSGVTRNGDDITFSGVNVNIVNGTGTTDGAVNGLGNLTVGYNEPRGSGDNRTGSHNIITGARNNYSSYGGLVAGNYNSISGDYSSVSGGNGNTATGLYSSISGGTGNIASGSYASVSGGASNTASGLYAGVSGGQSNAADDWFSSVSGGYDNTASGECSSVNGGKFNVADGNYSSVSGGYRNSANGDSSTIGGGSTGTVSGDFDWLAGSLFEDN